MTSVPSFRTLDQAGIYCKNPMNVHIRLARSDDAAPLADLLREIGWFAQIRRESSDATGLRVAKHLALALEGESHTMYVAESEAGELLGYIAVHWLPYLILAGPEGFISELFVRESMRGMRIGTRLIAAVAEEGRERGCARLQLINMRDRESYVRGFYSKAGWEERSDAADFIYRFEQPRNHDHDDEHKRAAGASGSVEGAIS